MYTYRCTYTHARENREIMRETRAQSRMCTRVSHGRWCSCNCVCRLGMLEVVWRRLSVGALAAWSLCSLSLSLLFHFASFLSVSLSLFLSPPLYSVHSSPHPSSPVPPNSPPFLHLPLTHLICPCSLPLASLFTSLSLARFAFKTPAGGVPPTLPEGTLTLSLSLSFQRTRRSSSHFPFALFLLLLLETPRLYF